VHIEAFSPSCTTLPLARHPNLQYWRLMSLTMVLVVVVVDFDYWWCFCCNLIVVVELDPIR
jgi:hypothetical protein